MNIIYFGLRTRYYRFLVAMRWFELVLIDKKTKIAAAERFNVTPATVRKWGRRYVSEGESGLEDRSSRPHNSPIATPPEKVEEIITMRK